MSLLGTEEADKHLCKLEIVQKDGKLANKNVIKFYYTKDQ